MDKKTLRLLFIGNSATYVHDVPETLAKLATEAGFPTEAVRITKGGYMLSQYTDLSTEDGQKVIELINQKYDIVFLQDNGNCIADDEKRSASKNACITLDAAIKATGAKTRIYVRPPYGYEKFGYSPLEQCEEFDKLFGEIANEIGAECSYVNRAFAYLAQHSDLNPYGDDNAHTSPEGAYLIVCTIFASLYNTSATILGTNGINTDTAKMLQQIADKISLEKYIPTFFFERK
ncbi:MAG: hypothetical protein IKL40_04915 [Clostridia bacterium]|nr:hypothetical protein [Clostridia bacterium]